jgi:hypothetical protein
MASGSGGRRGSVDMERKLKFLVMVIVLLTTLMAIMVAGHLTDECSIAHAEEAVQRPLAEEDWNDDAKLWLARSVLGEVGWRRFDEYSAVAWVYVTRAEQTKQYGFLEMIKQYSAAVREPGKTRNPWLFELDFTDTRPRSWPVNEDGSGPLWKGLYDQAWLETLEWADEWADGKHPNPCPGANHFGGYVDHYRAVAKRWKRIKCQGKMRNRFYTSLSLVSAEKALRM